MKRPRNNWFWRSRSKTVSILRRVVVPAGQLPAPWNQSSPLLSLLRMAALATPSSCLCSGTGCVLGTGALDGVATSAEPIERRHDMVPRLCLRSPIDSGVAYTYLHYCRRSPWDLLFVLDKRSRWDFVPRHAACADILDSSFFSLWRLLFPGCSGR